MAYANFRCTSETFRPCATENVRWLGAWEEYIPVAREAGYEQSPFTRAEWSEAAAEGFRYCGAIEDGRIVAMAAVWIRSEDEWEVAAVGAPPAQRRRGYGKAVVSFVTAHILQADRVATCSTNPNNTAMIKTVEGLGFQRC